MCQRHAFRCGEGAGDEDAVEVAESGGGIAGFEAGAGELGDEAVFVGF